MATDSPQVPTDGNTEAEEVDSYLRQCAEAHHRREYVSPEMLFFLAERGYLEISVEEIVEAAGSNMPR